MKIFTIACLLLLWPSVLQAGDADIRILNSTATEVSNGRNIHIFYQGQTIIVALSDELKNQKRGWQIEALLPGRRYGFNGKGIALVGVSMGMEPGEYSICIDDRCSDSDPTNELRVRILKTDFPKTRTAAYSGQPQPRRDKQKQAIDVAFNNEKGRDDFTGGSPYIDPLDKSRDISDPYGPIYRNNRFMSHKGVDLRAKVGTPVRTVNSGKVILVAKRFRREGNMLIISHGMGIFSVYMHLSKFGQVEITEKTKSGKLVKKTRQLRAGDMVEKGRIVALSGQTGAGVREPHLHFNIRIEDDYVDPLNFINTINAINP